MRRYTCLSICAVLLAALPVPARAQEVCARVRPDWDGAPVPAWEEAILLFGTPASLVLLLASALVLRFRSAWGALAVFVGWSLLVSAFTLFDPTGGQRIAAAAEGCIGSPVLFISIVMAIGVGLLLYTGKPKDDTPRS
ncbi:hypothetical protein FIU85_09070 [Roseovarius sp. THAF8]|uniref:hypothetical protein n=1 Tax=Roseovarius sp. THAF8 TaxID=2587846 RepID=UPI00126894EA|nr:hypothetical protein [Roseovarius sp. THAF8]QFT97450.1 hypothetical protein FIU85_09070 [Roseovarius sp. THAF8]